MPSPPLPSLSPYVGDKIIITVSGAHSNVGKTLLAEHILSLVHHFSAIKVTINDLCTSVTTDEASIMVPGKDTFRFKAAGAAQVVWVRSTEEDLFEAMQQALSLIEPCAGVLIEGNSAVPYFTADASFFVSGGPVEHLKQSRVYPLQKAHVIINNIRNESGDTKPIETSLRAYNTHAPILSCNLKNTAAVLHCIKEQLHNLIGPHILRGNLTQPI